MTCPHKHSHPPSPPKPSARYWRSLEELSQTKAFQDQVTREFPHLASEFKDDVSRRRFLQVMGASLALAGITTTGGCIRQREEIEPYVVPPEQVVPGRPLFFATSMPTPTGHGVGLLAESHEGRPTKLEGNPDHPASLGSTDAFSQASILSLYDPDRARTITQAGQVRTWSQFLSAFRYNGPRLHILTESITSPTLSSQLQQLLKLFPQAQWHQWQPINADNTLEASTRAFGQPVDTLYHLDRTVRILSLDSDFLSAGPAAIRHARDFSKKRKIQNNDTTSNRLYALTSTPTPTSSLADHRLSLPASQILPLAHQCLAAFQALAAGNPIPPSTHPFLQSAIADLWSHRGQSLVLPGEYQPADLHLLTHAINELLNAPGQTLTYIAPVAAQPTNHLASLTNLTAALQANEVSLLLILGSNPAYTAPADLNFSAALQKSSALKIHHSLHHDETSALCDWHIPETHYLESWSDLRAFDGAASLVQPLIYPLFQAWTPTQLLAALLGDSSADPRALVQSHWRSVHTSPDFDHFWLSALQKGVIPDTASPITTVRFNPASLPSLAAQSPTSLELQLRPDPTIHDGRFANNGWLQELPKPITRLVWDNAALISPATARQFSLSDHDLVELTLDNRSIQAPILILPGQPDHAVTLHLGYGRHLSTGTVANHAGFNAYPLRTSTNLHHSPNLQLKSLGRIYPLARTQTHFMIEHREEEILHVQPLADYLKPAEPTPRKINLSLYPEWNYTDRYPLQHRWGMSIDMNACTGCSACVVACAAENNSPVVGKDQVSRGREMHWLRIDTYYTGEPDSPQGPYFQPMLCQHCENAPCEIVCPVEATTHSSEGINEMTYNRCVGTRYCSNNCPYKVRRFNFLQYSDITPLAEMRYNPDVTVRQRGVMEKCTFCVQRVNNTRVQIKQFEGDLLRAETDQEKLALHARMDQQMRTLQTACQQACPSEAIVFGDLNWHYADSSRPLVIAEKSRDHSYSVLAELQTQPRVTYLPRLLNRNDGGAS